MSLKYLDLRIQKGMQSDNKNMLIIKLISVI